MFLIGILGKGVVIIFKEGKVVVLFDGIVMILFLIKYVIGIIFDNGCELLIYIGLNII